MDGATIKAVPWMPDHGHGTSVKPTVTPAGTAGTYNIANVYLFMPGLWQTTLTIQMPDQSSDQVVFSFCLNDQ